MAKSVWLAVVLCYYFYQSMISSNFVQCYFGHAYFYCAATLLYLMTVCSTISDNLKAIAVEGEVFFCLDCYWKLGFSCYYDFKYNHTHNYIFV